MVPDREPRGEHTKSPAERRGNSNGSKANAREVQRETDVVEGDPEWNERLFVSLNARGLPKETEGKDKRKCTRECTLKV